MTDRSVRVILTAATSQYQAAMAAAGASTKAVAAEVKKTSVSSRADLQTVGVGAAGMGAALFGGFVLATRATMGFDKQLSALSAVSGATAGDMEKLRQAALDAGQATVFSASEAALAETELAKVGISTADIMGGALTGALSLAAAGGLQLADAATIAGQAMKIFKLQGSDVGHVADLLAAGANKSAADVGQLGDALRMGGLVAAQTGLSIEETTAALAVFADNALIGSDAGTSLKTMLLALNPKSGDAAALMEQLGFAAYDAQGKFIGLEALAGELQSSFSGLTDEQRNAAMMTIFGTDAIRAANVLYTEGAAGVAEYETAVNDAGAAQRTAAEMTDNLAGDLERLGGTFEAVLIGTGDQSNTALREMVQALDGILGGYNALPGPIKLATTATMGLGGAMLLTLGGMSILAPRIVETKAAVEALGTSMPKTAAGMRGVGKAASLAGGLLTGPWGLALVGATIGIGLLGHANDQASREIKSLTDSLTFQNGALDHNSQVTLATALAQKGLFDVTTKLGYSEKEVTDAIVNGGAARDDMLRQLDDLVEAGRSQAAGARAGGTAMTQEGTDAAKAAGLIREHASALDNSARSSSQASSATADLGSAQEDTQRSIQELNDELRTQIDLLEAAAVGALDLTEAQIEFRKATREADDKLRAYNEAVAAHGEGSAAAKKAQREYNQSLRDAKRDLFSAADQARDTAKANAELAGSTDTAGAGADAYRGQLVKMRNQMAPGSALRRYLQGLIDKLDEVARDRTGTTTFSFRQVEIGASLKRHRKGHADGGWITGPGSGTSDSVPIAASAGEYVVRASAARRHGALLEAINSGATLTAVTGSGSSGSPVTVMPGAVVVDARGAAMNRQEFEAIANKAVNGMTRELVTQLRAS